MQFHTVAVDQHKCFSFLLISSPYECVNASLTWFIAPAWVLTFLFFFPISALPPQTSFPHPSVECAHEYRHWTRTPANCFCHQSVSFLFFFFLPQLLMLPAWHAAGRAQRRRKLHWWKVRALFFPFVCLSASSAFPRRPALPSFAATWLLFFPRFPPSHVSRRH